MIKTIIFDFGGVYFTNGTAKAIVSISDKYKIPEEKVRHVLSGELGKEFRCGQLTPDEFWKQAKEYWETNASQEDLSFAWKSEYRENKEMRELVVRLKDKEYNVLFLSDNNGERVDFLQKKFQFLGLFDDGVFSHIEGAVKPEKKLYEKVLEKTDAKPEECVYIDDKPELLEPAEELGMKVIDFESPEQVERVLKDMGVEL